MHNFKPETKQKIVSNTPTLASSEQESWNSFFKRNLRFIEQECSKYLYTHIKDDAVMEVMEQLINAKKRYQVKNERAWLKKVCRNHCIRKRRSRKKRSIYPIAEEVIQSPILCEEPTQTYQIANEQDEKEQLVKRALLYLKYEQAICVYYRYYEEKTYKEIARLTEYTTHQIKSYLQNGKRNLKAYLKEHGITSAY